MIACTKKRLCLRRQMPWHVQADDYLTHALRYASSSSHGLPSKSLSPQPGSTFEHYSPSSGLIKREDTAMDNIRAAPLTAFSNCPSPYHSAGQPLSMIDRYLAGALDTDAVTQRTAAAAAANLWG